MLSNNRTFSATAGLLLVLLSFSLASCGGEDPELLARLQEQENEIAALKAQDDMLQQKISSMPQGGSGDIAAAEGELRKLEREVGDLQRELTQLQERKSALEAEDQQYRSKYIID